MYVYIIGTLLSALLSLFAVGNKRLFLRDRELHVLHRRMGAFFLMILSVFPLTIISAIRYGVGTDFFSYQAIYTTFRFETSNLEIGVKLLIALLHKISDNPQIFFAVTSLWICVGYYIVIYQNSIDPAYSICLFVFSQEYFRSMNSIRQFMASVIVIQALPAVKEGKLKKVLIYTAIGMLFHMSAFMLIPLYMLCRIHMKPMQLFILSVIFLLFINSVRGIAVRLARFIGGRYTWYFNSAFAEGNFNPLVVAIYCAFLLLCEYLYDFQKLKQNETLNFVTSAAFIGMLLFLSRLVLPRNVTRLAYYMDPVLIIYSPELFRLISNPKLRIILKSMAFICYIFVFALAPNSNNNQLPYQTYWQ